MSVDSMQNREIEELEQQALNQMYLDSLKADVEQNRTKPKAKSGTKEALEDLKEEVTGDKEAQHENPVIKKELETLFGDYQTFSKEFYSYYVIYEKLLDEMDSEKFSDLPPEEYMLMVENAIRVHKGVVFSMKEMINGNKDMLNKFFEEEFFRKHPDKDPVIAIGPFIKFGYDKEAKNCYALCATEAELRAMFYQGVSSSEQQAFLINSFGIPKEYAPLVEMGEYMLPIRGTYLDAKDAYKKYARGDFWEGTASAGWAVVGAASDILIFIPEPTTSAIGAGGKALRGARAVNKGSKALKAAKAAKAARGGKLMKIASAAKDSSVKAFKLLRKHKGKTIFGLAAIDGVRQYYKAAPSDKHYAGDEIKYQDHEKQGTEPPLAFSKQETPKDKSPESLKLHYKLAIEQLKAEMGWSQLEYKIIDENSVRVYRKDCDQSITIRKKPDAEPTGWEVWELVGLGKAYNDIYQAVALANLLNKTIDIIKSNNHKLEDNAFEWDDGAIDANIDWDPIDLTLFSSGSRWMAFYQHKLGIDPIWVTRLFNRAQDRGMMA